MNSKIDTTFSVRNGHIQLHFTMPRWMIDELEYKPLYMISMSFPAGGDRESVCSMSYSSEQPLWAKVATESET